MINHRHLFAREVAILCAAEKSWPLRHVTCAIQAQAREDWLIRSRKALEITVDGDSYHAIITYRKACTALLAPA